MRQLHPLILGSAILTNNWLSQRGGTTKQAWPRALRVAQALLAKSLLANGPAWSLVTPPDGTIEADFPARGGVAANFLNRVSAAER